MLRGTEFAEHDKYLQLNAELGVKLEEACSHANELVHRHNLKLISDSSRFKEGNDVPIDGG